MFRRSRNCLNSQRFGAIRISLEGLDVHLHARWHDLAVHRRSRQADRQNEACAQRDLQSSGALRRGHSAALVKLFARCSADSG